MRDAPIENDIAIVILPGDWTGPECYYPATVKRKDIINRLLMLGNPEISETDAHVDIPRQGVVGITFGHDNTLSLESADVGLDSLNRNPFCLGSEDQ